MNRLLKVARPAYADNGNRVECEDHKRLSLVEPAGVGPYFTMVLSRSVELASHTPEPTTSSLQPSVRQALLIE